MTNVEYQIVLHALDAARLRLGTALMNSETLMNSDHAAERIRLLINMTVKACESAGFAAAIALTTKPSAKPPEVLPNG